MEKHWTFNKISVTGPSRFIICLRFKFDTVLSHHKSEIKSSIKMEVESPLFCFHLPYLGHRFAAFSENYFTFTALHSANKLSNEQQILGLYTDGEITMAESGGHKSPKIKLQNPSAN